MSLEFGRNHYFLVDIATYMRSGFIFLNSSEHVSYANPNALRLLGVGGLVAFTDQPVFDVRKRLVELAADPPAAQAELDRIWSHTEQESYADLALINAAVDWLRIQRFPVRDDPGQLLGHGILLEDITVEHSFSQTRSETLALAAHELKTPLAIIKGSATTLLGSLTRWDAVMQREMLQMIDMQADLLHDILNTLLDAWRLDAGVQNLRLSQVHLPALLSQLVEDWQKNAPRHRLVLSLPEEDVVVVCDATRIEQAFKVLLHNAVTYSPKGDTISLLLERNDVGVRLSISDEGIGIAHEQLERIFDRFYRTQQEDERSSGRGLGLSIARAIIQAHGGKIWADSPGLGRGATFYCLLPLVPRHAVPHQPSNALIVTGEPLAALPRSGLLKPGSRAKICIVENDARIMRYVRAHLEEQHYRVQTISSGVQFLRQLELDEPNLILLATRLVDMSGAEVLQQLREFSQTPVLLLDDTRGTDNEDERARLLDLGADDLVLKPFSMKDLLARVRVLLRRQELSREPSANEAVFTTGGLAIDYAQHLVSVQGRPVQLSRTEYKLLSVLARNVGRVMTHELLLERVWGAEYNREVDFIWVYISRLRRKIETNPRTPHYILTVPDVGYKLAKLPEPG